MSVEIDWYSIVTSVPTICFVSGNRMRYPQWLQYLPSVLSVGLEWDPSVTSVPTIRFFSVGIEWGSSVTSVPTICSVSGNRMRSLSDFRTYHLFCQWEQNEVPQWLQYQPFLLSMGIEWGSSVTSVPTISFVSGNRMRILSDFSTYHLFCQWEWNEIPHCLQYQPFVLSVGMKWDPSLSSVPTICFVSGNRMRFLSDFSTYHLLCQWE